MVNDATPETVTDLSSTMDDSVVLVLGTNPACRHAGRLLVEFGARVLRNSNGIEPDGYLDEGSLPLEGPLSEAQIAALVAGVDFCLLDDSWLPKRRALKRICPAAADRPRLHVWLTNFGITGPDAGTPATSATLWARTSGLMLNGDPSKPPLPPPGDIPYSSAACLGLIAALAVSLESPPQQRVTEVDVSALEATLFCLDFPTTEYQYAGTNARSRVGNRWPNLVVLCADGFISLIVTNESEWERFCGMIERPELLGVPEFATAALRANNAPRLEAILQPWFNSRTRHEIAEAAMTWRIAATPILHPRELSDETQYRRRGVFTSNAWAPHLWRSPDQPARTATDDRVALLLERFRAGSAS